MDQISGSSWIVCPSGAGESATLNTSALEAKVYAKNSCEP